MIDIVKHCYILYVQLCNHKSINVIYGLLNIVTVFSSFSIYNLLFRFMKMRYAFRSCYANPDLCRNYLNRSFIFLNSLDIYICIYKDFDWLSKNMYTERKRTDKMIRRWILFPNKKDKRSFCLFFVFVCRLIKVGHTCVYFHRKTEITSRRFFWSFHQSSNRWRCSQTKQNSFYGKLTDRQSRSFTRHKPVVRWYHLWSISNGARICSL